MDINGTRKRNLAHLLSLQASCSSPAGISLSRSTSVHHQKPRRIVTEKRKKLHCNSQSKRRGSEEPMIADTSRVDVSRGSQVSVRRRSSCLPSHTPSPSLQLRVHELSFPSHSLFLALLVSGLKITMTVIFIKTQLLLMRRVIACGER